MTFKTFAGATLGGLIAALAIGSLVYRHEKAPESSPVTRGAELATAAGCFACHSHTEDGAFTNFRRNAEGIWQPHGIDLLWNDGVPKAESIVTWITHGVPESKRARHKQLLIQMPAYGDEALLTPAQINDLAAYAISQGLTVSHGMGNADQPRPDLLDDTSTAGVAVVATLPADTVFQLGDRLARGHGCYQCHGELGQGGPANLASFKGYIPGFQGSDFRELTANGDPAEIRQWIETGHGHAIESGPLGRLAIYFFEKQGIPMPAYGTVLNPTETAVLVAYLQQLNQRGPLDATALESVAKLLAAGSADQ